MEPLVIIRFAQRLINYVFGRQRENLVDGEERRKERRGKDAKLIVRENKMIVTNDI